MFKLALKAFPDFDLATIPEVPEGFTDSSWKNDACPSLMDEERGLEIYIDYLSPDMRESGPTVPRFTLLHRNPDGTADTIRSSNSWPVIKRAIPR